MDKTYFNKIVENLELINETQSENIKKAASLMADAIEQDRLINVYGGGGHTTLCMGEMFFRAGGLANINPIVENGLTVFNQALKYLELERTVNYGSAIMKYYKLQPGDLLNQGGVYNGFTSASTKIAPVSGTEGYNSNYRFFLGHLQNQVSSNSTMKERYILILGFTFNETGAEKIDIKLYFVNGGALQPYMVTSLSSKDLVSVKNNKLVIYGNNTMANVNVYDPSEVCFRYSQPADSVENLIKGLGNEYAYKELLAKKFNVTTGSVTVKNEAGEVLSQANAYANYTLPVSNTKGFIGYEIEGKLYGAGTVLAVNSPVVATEVTLDLAMTAGARIRAKQTEGHYGGLRFETTLTASKLEAWAQNIALYGVVIPTEAINGEFEVNEAGSKKVQLVNFVEKEEKNVYYITLTDVYYYNYNRAFSARAYAEVTYADGKKAEVALTDYSVENNSRSVYQVAKMALADTEYGYSQAQIDFLKGYVNYTVDVTVVGDKLAVLSTTDYYSITESESGYTVTVNGIPTHLAEAGYLPVSVWEEVDGVLQIVRTVIVKATVVDGNFVSEIFE